MKWTIRALLVLGFAMLGAAAFIRPNSDNAFPKGGLPRDQTRGPAVEAGNPSAGLGKLQLLEAGSPSPAVVPETTPSSGRPLNEAPSLFHLPHFKTEAKEPHGDLTT